MRLQYFCALAFALAFAGCKTRPGAGTVKDADNAPVLTQESLSFQPYDAIGVSARKKVGTGCIAAPAPDRAWADSGEKPLLNSGNFPPGATAVDTAMPAALDAAAWETRQAAGLTIYSMKADANSASDALKSFAPKGAHVAGWVGASPFASGVAAAAAAGDAQGLVRVGLVVARKLISAKKPAKAEVVPADLPATAATYQRCGDATVEREYLSRDLVFVVFSKDGKYEGARTALIKSLSGEANEADERALADQIGANTVLLRALWQEGDKPMEVLDAGFVGLAEAYRTSADLGVKSAFYLAKPYAAFAPFDEQNDKPGGGLANDFGGLVGLTYLGRVSAAIAANDGERAAVARANGDLQTAVDQCGGLRFNDKCQGLLPKFRAFVAAIPDRVVLAGFNPAAISTRLQGCRRSLKAGESMKKGDAICAPNGRFALVVQGDDNLVLYDVSAVKTDVVNEVAARTAKWASNTSDGVKAIGTGLTLDADGGLRLTSRNDGVLWSAKTAGKGPSTLTVSDDGFAQLNVDAGGAETWTSKSWRQEEWGPLDAEPMCGTYKGRVRRALEQIETQAAFDAMETAFDFAAGGKLNKDGALGGADLAAELGRLADRAQKEVTAGSAMVAELLGGTGVASCIAALSGNPAAIELSDVTQALVCARRPRSTSLGEACPDWGTASPLAPESADPNDPQKRPYWKRYGLIVPADDPAKRWLSGSVADAEAFCTKAGRRLPTRAELVGLFQDYGVMDVNEKLLRNELFGMVFLLKAAATPVQLTGYLVPTTQLNAADERIYAYFDPDPAKSGMVRFEKTGTRSPMTWVCVAERKDVLP